MKLLVVILSQRDADPVIKALIEADFRVTQVASTGGFLRRGNTTLFVGIEEKRVEQAFELLRASAPETPEAGQSRATVFVLNVAHFEQV